MSHIVALEVQNVKRLTAVSVKPNGALVVVGGRNAQGKTSVLDAIMMALGGEKGIPNEPLRRGADKGQVVVELDDGMIVRRTFTPGGGGALTVTNKEGARYGSPQKLLDALTGKLTFDPLAFSRMDRKAQAQTLRDLIGLDFSDLDGKRKAAFDERTDANREVKRIEGALAKLPPVPEGTPEQEVLIDELATELERRKMLNQVMRGNAHDLEAMRARAVVIKDQITDLEEQLAAVTDQGKLLAARVAAAVELDESEVLEQMRALQTTNAAARTLAERRRLQADLDAQSERAMDLTGKIQSIDDAKREATEAAAMPIEGLAFDESGVTLNGLPLDQASGAEQLRASVAIGLAMHPKLKVLLVRDGSLLDEDGMRLVAEMAEAAGGQVWLERVGDGDECSIVIEDGMVHGAPASVGSKYRQPGEEG